MWIFGRLEPAPTKRPLLVDSLDLIGESRYRRRVAIAGYLRFAILSLTIYLTLPPFFPYLAPNPFHLHSPRLSYCRIFVRIETSLVYFSSLARRPSAVARPKQSLSSSGTYVYQSTGAPRRTYTLTFRSVDELFIDDLTSYYSGRAGKRSGVSNNRSAYTFAEKIGGHFITSRSVASDKSRAKEIGVASSRRRTWCQRSRKRH